MSGSQDARIANSAFGTGKGPLTTEKHVKKPVFVHGLQGHPAKTWTFGDFRGPDDEHYESIKDPFASSDPGRLRSLFNRKKKSPAASERGQPGLFWPETLLKDHEHCQTARVMTYGYNSEIIRLGAPVNWNTISDHGESLLIGLANERSESPDRPLMFLVHSLGGLIVKSALIDSAAGKKEDLRAVSRATFAIIFFGTPHRGSAYASMGTTISKIAHLATGKPVNTSVVNSLNRNTEILTKLRKNFLLLLENIVKENGYESSTFQESIPYSKGIPALDGKIVDDDSSEMGHSCDRNNHIERNHMDMCKFSGPEDSEYQKVSGEIKRHIIRLQEMIIQERRICLNCLDNPELDLQHLPISRATESTLKWILSSNDQSGTGLARWLQNGSGVFWINGRPGSGKSTAMRYLVEHDKTKELVECKGAKWDIIASFFIDRGSKSQRSGESILRHILFQLLKARPPLIDQVLRFTKRKDVIVPEKSLSKLDETTEKPVYEWDERSVKTALLYCKGQNKTPFRSCIFLDGLDEHEGDHNEFGRFILSLASRTDETELNTIKICVASRPEQVFND